MHNKRLQARLLRHADKPLMFHYLDSVNNKVYGDPLLVRTPKHRFHWGYIVTLLIGLLALGLLFLNEVIKHA